VDDQPAEIQKALRFATANHVRLVIVTGGLGPTDNDVTRESLSEFTNIPLHEHPDVLDAMERRFRTPRDRLRDNLRRQAQVPKDGGYLENKHGTSYGLVFEHANHVIVALPGPPRELQPMVREQLVPYLNKQFGTRMPGSSLTLRFIGLGQSQINQTLKEHVPLPPDVMLSSQFEGGRVDFTFALPHDTPQDRDRLDRIKLQVLQHLGDHIYADNADTTLEQRVVELLQQQKATLAIAEVGGGGTVVAGLSGADNLGRVLIGAYVAPTENQLHSMLGISDNRWRELAAEGQHARLSALVSAVAESTGSRWSMAIGEPMEDPDNRALVQVVWRHPDGSFSSLRTPSRGTGEPARARLATTLLDHLRRMLEAPKR